MLQIREGVALLLFLALPASAADIPEEIAPDQTRQIEVYILIQCRHYMQNAKTFYELGDALGRAMAELLKHNP